MKSTLQCLVVFLMTQISFTGQGQAIPFDPQLDFRAEEWSGADYASSYTQVDGGVEVTLIALPSLAELFWCAEDGIGIRHNYEVDEIEADERLRVLFDTTVQLSAIYVSDLFVENGYSETGSYRLWNGSGPWGEWQTLDAATLPGTGSNGEHVLSFADAIAVTEINFKAPGLVGAEDHEFSVAGFDLLTEQGPVDPPSPGSIPEPSSLVLLSAGFVVLTAARRRALKSA